MDKFIAKNYQAAVLNCRVAFSLVAFQVPLDAWAYPGWGVLSVYSQSGMCLKQPVHNP